MRSVTPAWFMRLCGTALYITFLVCIDKIEDIAKWICYRTATTTPFVHNNLRGLSTVITNPFNGSVKIFCFDEQS